MVNQLDSIEDALEDIRLGKIVIVVDDEDRENEGDFVAAAEMVTPEMINYMATHGRGLICAPIIEKRAEELNLDMMVGKNTDPNQTQFTVSVDLIGQGCTTGISAKDRAKTIQALIDPKTKADDVGRPGHIFPLKARNGGVLRRTGHTEATVDLARLAGMQPAGVITEIMNDDGSMARLPQLIEVAKKFQLKIVSIEDLVSYRMEHDSLIEKKSDTLIKTRYGDFRLRAYEQTTNGNIHLALTKGHWKIEDEVLTRIHSSRITNDILGTLTGSVEKGLDDIFKLINNEGKGALLFINQEQTSENLLSRISELESMQLKGTLDKAPPMKMDAKDYGIGAQILHDLNIKNLCVISNTAQQPRIGITGYGITIQSFKNY